MWVRQRMEFTADTSASPQNNNVVAMSQSLSAIATLKQNADEEMNNNNPTLAAVENGAAATTTRRTAAPRRRRSGRRSSDDGLDFGYSSDSSSSQYSSTAADNNNRLLVAAAASASTAVNDQLLNSNKKRFLSTIARSLTGEFYNNKNNNSQIVSSRRFCAALPTAFSDSELFPNCRASTSFYYNQHHHHYNYYQRQNNNNFCEAASSSINNPQQADDIAALIKSQSSKFIGGGENNNNNISAERRRVCVSASSLRWRRGGHTPGSGGVSDLVTATGNNYYQVTWQENSSSGGGRLKRWRDWCKKLAFSEEEWSESEQQKIKKDSSIVVHEAAVEAQDAFSTEFASISSSSCSGVSSAAFTTCVENEATKSKENINILTTTLSPLRRNSRQQRRIKRRTAAALSSSSTVLSAVDNKLEGGDDSDEQIENNYEPFNNNYRTSIGTVVKSRSYNEFANLDTTKSDRVTKNAASDDADDDDCSSVTGASVVAPLVRSSPQNDSDGVRRRGQRPTTFVGLKSRHHHAASALALMIMSPPGEATQQLTPSSSSNSGTLRRSNARRPHSWCINTNTNTTVLPLQTPDLDSAASHATLVAAGDDDNDDEAPRRICSVTTMISPETPPMTNATTRVLPVTPQAKRKTSSATTTSSGGSTTDDNDKTLKKLNKQKIEINSDASSLSDQMSDQFWDDYQAPAYDSAGSNFSGDADGADDDDDDSGEEGTRATQLRRLLNFGENYDEYMRSGLSDCYLSSASTSSKFSGKKHRNKTRGHTAVQVMADQQKTLKRHASSRVSLTTQTQEEIPAKQTAESENSAQTKNDDSELTEFRNVLARAQAASSEVSSRFGGRGACTPDALPGSWLDMACSSSVTEEISYVEVGKNVDSHSKSGQDSSLTTNQQPAAVDLNNASFFDAAQKFMQDCSTSMRSLLEARQQVETSLAALRNQPQPQHEEQQHAGIVKMLTILDSRLTLQLDSLQRVSDECSTLRATVNRQAQAMILLEVDLDAIDLAINSPTWQDEIENINEVKNISAKLDDLRREMAALSVCWSSRHNDDSGTNSVFVLKLKTQATAELRRLLKDAGRMQSYSLRLLKRLSRNETVSSQPEEVVVSQSIAGPKIEKRNWVQRALLYSIPFHAFVTIGLLFYFAASEMTLFTPDCCTNSLYRSTSSSWFVWTLQYAYSGDTNMPPI